MTSSTTPDPDDTRSEETQRFFADLPDSVAETLNGTLVAAKLAYQVEQSLAENQPSTPAEEEAARARHEEIILGIAATVMAPFLSSGSDTITALREMVPHVPFDQALSLIDETLSNPRVQELHGKFLRRYLLELWSGDTSTT